MPIKSLVMLGVGSFMMGWGGSMTGNRIGPGIWNQMNLALFAFGIILLAQAPYVALLARVRRLEAQLKAPDSDAAVTAR